MGVLFWPFTLNEIIIPFSQIVWLLVRVLILSVDQKYYWIAIILVAIFVLLIRQLITNQATSETLAVPDSNATIKAVENWRILFSMNDENNDEIYSKRELIHLLLILFSIKQQTEANYILFDALEQGEIPLPAYIHAYLFGKPENDQNKFLKHLNSLCSIPRKWMRHWSGQDKAEHYQMINEVLRFIETSLEMKNDK
jgi:hypothetical protein